MAIEGSLRELALSDVLQLLDLSRKTGVLTLRRDASEPPSALLLEQGSLVGAVGHDRTRRIGELLLLAGKVTQAQIDRAAAEQRRQPARRLGSLLVELGSVSTADVERQLRFQIEELVFDVARWFDGHFRFDETPARDLGDVVVRIPTETVLMEAARRMDEWAEMARGAPDTELVPSLVDGGGAVLDLQPGEWEVLAWIDGERSLRTIARELGRGEFEVAKAVFSLVAAGVVEVGNRRRAPAEWQAQPEGEGEHAELERALAAGRLDEVDRATAELLRSAPDRADVRLLRGRLELARERWADAVPQFTEAARLDPLLAPVYYFLGMALVRDGELERAEQALRTFLRLADTADRERMHAERAMRAVAELRNVLAEVAA